MKVPVLIPRIFDHPHTYLSEKFGKLKTVFQHGMVLIILLVNPSQAVVNFIVYINAIYSALTGIHYFVKNGF